jgi:hypothetical protein
MAGVIPFKPLVGGVPLVVVAFNDISTSGGVGGRAGGRFGEAVGLNEAVMASRDGVGSSTAGELGSCMLWILMAECADIVDVSDSEELSGLNSRQYDNRDVGRVGG